MLSIQSSPAHPPALDDAGIHASLRALAGKAPAPVEAAGRHLFERADARNRKFLLGRRKAVEKEREQLELAKNIALRRAQLPGLPADDGASLKYPHACRDNKRVANLAQELAAYQERCGDLDGITALEAYARQRIHDCHENEASRGQPLTPDDELRADAEGQFDLVDPDSNHMIGLFLGLEIKKLLDLPETAVRRTSDWWEIVVAILAMIDMDLPLQVLGVPAVLSEEITDEEVHFRHRDQLRRYAFAEPIAEGAWGSHDQEEHARWERAQRLGLRALTMLSDGLVREPEPAPESSDEAGKRRRRPRGRPRMNTDAQDKNVWEARRAGRDYVEIGRYLGLTEIEVRRAVDRHRKRQAQTRQR